MSDFDFGTKCKMTADGKWEIRSGRHLDPFSNPHSVQWFLVPTSRGAELEHTHLFDNFWDAEQYLLENIQYHPWEIIDCEV